MKHLKSYAVGFLIGLCNALFGAGGGMLAVPYLRAQGLAQRQAQTSAMGVILPLSLLSAGVYLFRGYVTLRQALPFLPFAFLGALFGTFLMKKTGNRLLHALFASLMLWAGLRMLVR